RGDSVTITKGSYLLWFARYGHLEFRQMDSVDEAVELVVSLRDADTAVFDQYGVAEALECVGKGVVEDFDRLCDEYEERRAAEAEAARKERARELEENPPGPRYSICVSPPEG